MASKNGTAKKQEHFEQIFERYYRPVNYYFARRGCPREDCRDLAQETFLGAYKGIERYREDAEIETWLYVIAGNIWRNWLRSRSTLKRSAHEVSLDQEIEDRREPVSTAEEDDSLGTLLLGEQWDLVRGALEELPPRMRFCLHLRIDQGLKYDEIATVMGISIQTVKSQLYQARERLKEALKDHSES